MTNSPPDQRMICALMDARYWFDLTEGRESERATEALEHILSAGDATGATKLVSCAGGQYEPKRARISRAIEPACGGKVWMNEKLVHVIDSGKAVC